MNRRWIDTAITKFTGALLGTTFGLFFVIALWVGLTDDSRQFPYLNVAFVWSWVISILLLLPILWMAKTRPADREQTWGEAMLGATYVFFLLFWIYGVVPHQWLTFSEGELAWRADRFLRGPDLPWDSSQGIVEWALPFDVTYRAIQDIIAVLIYGIGLVANLALWGIWQNRGKVADGAELEATSRYGRPVAKTAEVTAEKVGV